jgi:hypothetical protein
MAVTELPAEAAEADVLEQQAEIRPDADEPRIGEPVWEADPADVAEQALPVDDEEDYPDTDR